jgi:[ribosomal protein S5]-alanine N-acetyltransferase
MTGLRAALTDRHEQPTLATPRLRLRPFELDDAYVVQQLAGAFEIADTSLDIPHPYREGVAEAWILTHKQLFRAGVLANFAVTLRLDGVVIGAIGLRIEPAHRCAELGYWIGHGYWNCGYCTEAAQALLAYGFDMLHLNRIHAAHLSRNPASGRVLQKLGMQHEGTLRQQILKWQRFEDVEKYGLLALDYRRRVVT